jgi:hypothetical protein
MTMLFVTYKFGPLGYGAKEALWAECYENADPSGVDSTNRLDWLLEACRFRLQRQKGSLLTKRLINHQVG